MSGSLAQDGILAVYDLSRTRLEAFRITCHRLIESLLGANDLVVHSVTSRVKTRESLSAKLARPGRHYVTLHDVTDIVGVRVVTYFDDEVDRVGDILTRELLVDASRSVDKRAMLEADRFGYLSTHFVCSLGTARLALPEHSHCVGLTAEIQLRTILQHAWAEIEHDLGYKATAPVALPLRRRFNRLAGLLELADGEFRALRDALGRYKDEVRSDLDVCPAEVRIDEVSLGEFIHGNELCRRLDVWMAEFIGARLTPPSHLPLLADYLQYVHIRTVQELSDSLARLDSVISDVWRRRLTSDAQMLRDARALKRLQGGISIYHLSQVLAVEQGGLERLFLMCQRNAIESDADGPSAASRRGFLAEAGAVIQQALREVPRAR